MDNERDRDPSTEIKRPIRECDRDLDSEGSNERIVNAIEIP